MALIFLLIMPSHPTARRITSGLGSCCLAEIKAQGKAEERESEEKAHRRGISSGRRYPLRWIKDHGEKKVTAMGPEAIVIRGVLVLISLGHYVSRWAAVGYCFRSSIPYRFLKAEGFLMVMVLPRQIVPSFSVFRCLLTALPFSKPV